jgi:5-methylthioadenosine/S-adenosylhomocysteine deaminase
VKRLASKQSLLIRGATIVTMNDEREIIPDGELLIEKGRITSVGRACDPPVGWRQSKAERVINATGRAVLPGLINAHNHAAMSLFRGYADDLPLMRWLEDRIWPLEAKLAPEDVYWGTALAVLEMIRGGTTSFADMYFYMDQVAEVVRKTGVRAVLSRGLVGSGPEGVTALEDTRKFAAEWHKGAGGRVRVAVGPHAPYTCPPDYLKQVAAAARELELPVHIHVAETRDEVETIHNTYGATPVQYLERCGLFDGLRVTAAHCVHLSDSDIRILADRKVRVVSCPGSNLKLAAGVAPLAKLIAAGVCVGLGTDGPASCGALDMWEQMRLGANLQKAATGEADVITAYEALNMATRGGARALGLDGLVGAIIPGMIADVIVVNLERAHMYPPHDVVSSLVYAGHPEDVETVIVAGEPVMEERLVLNMDEREVLATSAERARRLAAPKPKPPADRGEPQVGADAGAGAGAGAGANAGASAATDAGAEPQSF